MTILTTIDLNCDLGEGCGHDAELVPLISSANISCGAHAGDADIGAGGALRLAPCVPALQPFPHGLTAANEQGLHLDQILTSSYKI